MLSPCRYDVGEERGTFFIFLSGLQLVQILHHSVRGEVLPGVCLQLYHVIVEESEQNSNNIHWIYHLHYLLLQSAIQIISPIHQSIKCCIYFCDAFLVQDITDHCLCLGDDLLQIIDFLRYNIQLVRDPFK